MWILLHNSLAEEAKHQKIGIWSIVTRIYNLWRAERKLRLFIVSLHRLLILRTNLIYMNVAKHHRCRNWTWIIVKFDDITKACDLYAYDIVRQWLATRLNITTNNYPLHHRIYSHSPDNQENYACRLQRLLRIAHALIPWHPCDAFWPLMLPVVSSLNHGLLRLTSDSNVPARISPPNERGTNPSYVIK